MAVAPVTALLRLREGQTRPLALDLWCADASVSERRLLRSLDGPVLDLGCGPGRFVAALGEMGTPALGVDASPHAVARAVARGASALRHSVFDPLPAEGRWATVLLLDGNVGIGGDPTLLLQRVEHLLDPSGRAVVEVDPPGSPTTLTEARLEAVDGRDATPWFPWAWVAADGLEAFAGPAGLELQDWRVFDGRWFAVLAPSDGLAA